ncbi:hypothetical protein VNO78_12978 [Psophocarpus tetragonolobus]|uniref:Uncharacterized protein n=1 Tax=Psophocarpus tetragonolobus TaxID=3891 RepID=A0AAN9XPA9_PSOTE
MRDWFLWLCKRCRSLKPQSPLGHSQLRLCPSASCSTRLHLLRSLRWWLRAALLLPFAPSTATGHKVVLSISRF